MDLASALALGLQAAAFQQGAGSEGLYQHVQSNYASVCRTSDPLLQALAQSLLPLDDLQRAAQKDLKLNRFLKQKLQLSEEDYLAQRLVYWFKHNFFEWVDAPACQACNHPTAPSGTERPNFAEQAHQASRTEVYRCTRTTCHATTRFPRYNDVEKLLETRCGRCGEWANCFLLFCRAAGLTARYVLDTTDHVWTEYWSHAMQRWVHLDSCEAAWDTPLLYEAGWGKKLQCVVAISVDGATDVTRRYTRKYQEVVNRRVMEGLPAEVALKQRLQVLTAGWRQGLTASEREAAAARDALELKELDECSRKGLSEADLALPGRLTGSESWRSQRGEDGASTSSTAAAAPPPSAPPTDYKWAEAEPLDALYRALGRLAGGVCRASGENGAEAVQTLFDDRPTTKWLDFAGGGEGGAAWVEYRLLDWEGEGEGEGGVGAGVTLVQYDLVCAKETPERDPSTWVLEGWAGSAGSAGGQEDGGPPLPRPGPPSPNSPWTVLDFRTGVTFTSRYQTLTFTPRKRTPCRAFRLRITRTHQPAAANCVQLGGLHLYASTPLTDPELKPTADLAAALVEAGQQSATGDTQALVVKELERLRTIVRNVAQNPGEGKYRRIKVGKVQGLLDWRPEVLPLLFRAGFRLTRVPAEAGAVAVAREERVVVAPEQPEVQTSMLEVAGLLGAV